MARLTVLCFAGTYSLALFADLARSLVRARARWSLTVGLTALGWVVHTAYLANIAMQTHELPVATIRESLLVLAWILAAIDLYLVVRSPTPSAVGLFILPVVVGLSAFAGLERERAVAVGWAGSVKFWGAVHGGFWLLGAVFTCVAFAFGLMYLVQAERLRHKRPGRLGFTLPSLEQSERWNRWAITVAFPLLTIGFWIGVLLVPATRSYAAPSLRWTDPKILSAAGLWLFFAVLLNARFRPAMRGRRVMVLSVVAFAFLLFTWVGVGLLVPTAHGAPAAAAAGRAL
jgi:ABC-type transport system involved in cytochrome c biogenesis permease subunit